MINEIVKKIIEYDKIIIHRHESPDPDAIGSQAGLCEMIKHTFPQKEVYIVGEIDHTLTFLATMDQIPDETYQNALVIVTDTANTERISDKRYDQGDFLIKIDHHPNHDRYGDLVWVKTEASSTSEMIYELFAESSGQLKLNDQAAFYLYAGIVGDTGRFLYSNTTSTTHKYVGELLTYNFDVEGFYRRFYQKSLKIARLEGYVLQNFEMIDGVLGVMRLTKELLEQFQVTTSESSLLVNSFSNVEGLLAWVYFVEDEEYIRVRLRSKGPVINQVAQKYHGGGHPLASGARVATWEETEQIICDLLEVCKEYKRGVS